MQGLKQPGNEIDVFLETQIDDLQKPWTDGVKVFDTHERENSGLLFCTINNYPALANLSRQSTKGE